jgi:hypothetical protein
MWATGLTGQPGSRVHLAHEEVIDGVRSGGRTRLHICGNTRFCPAAWAPAARWWTSIPGATASPLADGASSGTRQPQSRDRAGNGTPDDIVAALAACHRDAGARYIVGPGCEVPRDTPHENLRALCEFARHHRPAHAAG